METRSGRIWRTSCARRLRRLGSAARRRGRAESPPPRWWIVCSSRLSSLNVQWPSAKMRSSAAAATTSREAGCRRRPRRAVRGSDGIRARRRNPLRSAARRDRTRPGDEAVAANLSTSRGRSGCRPRRSVGERRPGMQNPRRRRRSTQLPGEGALVDHHGDARRRELDRHRPGGRHDVAASAGRARHQHRRPWLTRRLACSRATGRKRRVMAARGAAAAADRRTARADARPPARRRRHALQQLGAERRGDAPAGPAGAAAAGHRAGVAGAAERADAGRAAFRSAPTNARRRSWRRPKPRHHQVVGVAQCPPSRSRSSRRARSPGSPGGP